MCWKIFAVVYLTGALISVQGAGWHLHTTHHDHLYDQSSSVASHAQHALAHTVYDASASHHVDDVAPEVNYTLAGVLKMLSLAPLVMALLIAAIIVVAPTVYIFGCRRRSGDAYPAAMRCPLRPPLRAPPR